MKDFSHWKEYDEYLLLKRSGARLPIDNFEKAVSVGRGDEIVLRREPDNRFDKNCNECIKVIIKC